MSSLRVANDKGRWFVERSLNGKDGWGRVSPLGTLAEAHYWYDKQMAQQPVSPLRPSFEGSTASSLAEPSEDEPRGASRQAGA